MLAHYGIDVLDPAVSYRRVWTLLRRLPAGAWTDEESLAYWSIEAHLLADVVDALASIAYMLGRLGGGKPKQPKPVPRPGPKPVAPARRRMSWGEYAMEGVSGR
jgi:hypothetical protein